MPVSDSRGDPDSWNLANATFNMTGNNSNEEHAFVWSEVVKYANGCGTENPESSVLPALAYFKKK